MPALDVFPREAWARALAQAARTASRAALGLRRGRGLPACARRRPPTSTAPKGCGSRRKKCSSPPAALRPSAWSLGPFCAAREGRSPERAVARESLPAGPERPPGQGRGRAGRGPRGRRGPRPPAPCRGTGARSPSSRRRISIPWAPSSRAPRRAALVEWARATDSIIVEDDFDGEFRYGGAPLQPLRELETLARRLPRILQQVLAPGPPPGLCDTCRPPSAKAWRGYRELIDIHSCAFTQAAMASMLETGAFDRHVQADAQNLLRKTLRPARASRTDFRPQGRGGLRIGSHGEAASIWPLSLRTVGRFCAGSVFDEETVSLIAQAGAIVYPPRRYASAPCRPRGGSFSSAMGISPDWGDERGLAARGIRLGARSRLSESQSAECPRLVSEVLGGPVSTFPSSSCIPTRRIVTGVSSETPRRAGGHRVFVIVVNSRRSIVNKLGRLLCRLGGIMGILLARL